MLWRKISERSLSDQSPDTIDPQDDRNEHGLKNKDIGMQDRQRLPRLVDIPVNGKNNR